MLSFKNVGIFAQGKDVIQNLFCTVIFKIKICLILTYELISLQSDLKKLQRNVLISTKCRLWAFNMVKTIKFTVTCVIDVKTHICWQSSNFYFKYVLYLRFEILFKLSRQKKNYRVRFVYIYLFMRSIYQSLWLFRRQREKLLNASGSTSVSKMILLQRHYPK